MRDEGRSQMADAIEAVAKSIHSLGTADAATPMGAVETLAMEVRDGTTRIAEALNNIAQAINDHTTFTPMQARMAAMNHRELREFTNPDVG